MPDSAKRELFSGLFNCALSGRLADLPCCQTLLGPRDLSKELQPSLDRSPIVFSLCF